MRRFADETTVHGVKETANASRFGRVFWILVFTSSVSLMALQLRGVFTNFVKQNVGTRITPTIRRPTLEQPSMYFCNQHWLPTPKAFRELMDCAYEKDSPEAFPSPYGYIGDKQFYMKCYKKYWSARIVEDFVNALLGFDYKESNEASYIAHGYWLVDQMMPIHERAEVAETSNEILRKLLDKIENDYNGSLIKFIRNATTLEDYRVANGIMTKWQEREAIIDGGKYKSAMEVYFSIMKIFQAREGRLSVTNHGVCWEFRPTGPLTGRTGEIVKKKTTHIVLHFGGYGFGLNHFTDKWGYDKGYDNRSHLYRKIPFDYRNDDPYFDFKTNAFLGRQRFSYLPSENQIELSARRPIVTVKFWTNERQFKNRRGWPCKEDWSTFDHVRCMHEIYSQLKPDMCRRYFPETKHFNETEIFNTTCLGAVDNLLLNAVDVEFQSRSGKIRPDVEPHIPPASCPPPCEVKTFNFELTYSVQDEVHEKICQQAVAAQVLDTKRRAGSYTRHQNIAGKWKWNTSPVGLPCSIVTYIQTESYGQVIEEYFLYGLPDVASSVGGTLGLWIGASILSFIQAFYICITAKRVGLKRCCRGKETSKQEELHGMRQV